jgi:hypothetical protein
MANAVAVNDSPLKGNSPVPANTIVTAHDHTSAAAVTRVPASCSGAMNAGVPTVAWPERPMVVIPGTAASPKSITTGPSGPSRTLAGLKSRCTIPAACTAPSAVSVATAMRSSAAPPRGPNCSTSSTSDGPLTYSLTMNGRRSKIPASRTCAVQKRATRCAAATSFRKRLRTCGSVVGGRSLTAAGLPVGPSPRTPRPARLPRGGRATGIHPPRADPCRAGQASPALWTKRMSPSHSAPAAQRTPRFHFASRLPAFPAAAYAFEELLLAATSTRRRARSARPQDDSLGREHGKFPFETRFGPGMLLEKPGPRSALGAGSEPGQGQGPGSTVPPHGARGSAPPQARGSRR